MGERTLIVRLWRYGPSRIGIVALVLLIVFAVGAPLLAGSDPLLQDRANRFLSPSPFHPFGTDEFGRDIFSRVVYGARPSLATALGVVLMAAMFGVPLGLVGGYFGRTADAVIMRLMDSLLAIPAILLAMAIVAVLGASGFSVAIAVGVVSVPAYARLTRASTLSLKEREFVLAARSIGAGTAYIMVRTILPNAVSPLIVQSANVAAHAILLEAALSFLGLGMQPPEPSWGSILSAARSFIEHSPWYGLLPGIVITICVIALNGIGAGLQLALNPASLRGTRE